MPQVNSSLITILAKIAIFEVLPNFDPIFRGEGVQMAKKTEDMLKTVDIAS